MYSRLSKVFHFLSVVLFLIAFLYMYSASPESVTYELSEGGLPVGQVSKEAFFYLMVGLFLVSNVLLIVPAKLIELQYTTALKRVFPKGDLFRERVLSWIYSFAGVVNLSTVIFIFYLYTVTHRHEVKSGDFSLFFYLVPFFFALWILALFYILASKIKQMKQGASIS